LAYTKFILDSVQARPLFQMLTLEPARLWECLAFMDAANYGGILADGQEDDDDNDDPEAAAARNDGKATLVLSSGRTLRLAVHSHWNLADYLPQGKTQEFFLITIANFLLHPYKVRLEQLERNATSLAQRRAESAEFSASQHLATLGQTAEQEDADIVTEVSSYISQEFSRQLFDQVAYIKRALRGNEGRAAGDEEAAAIQFPVLAGSYLPLHNPALEFVKSVCKVLSLDKSLDTPTRLLRESLMKIVGVKSFAPEATFVNPCLTFVLPDVICSYCNQCRDLDLCRDPELVFHHWRCTVCAQPYDLGVIEWMLVEYVQRRAVAYQVQDLACATCGKIKQSNMAKFCPCSGHFVNSFSPQQFDASMRTFANIAVYHNFAWLLETITFIRERQPEIVRNTQTNKHFRAL
jgi:DNA polymerase epsilon subunit 1